MCKHIYLLNILVHIWSVCVCVCVDIHTHTHTLIHRKFIEWYIYIYINTSLSDVTFTKSCVCVHIHMSHEHTCTYYICLYTHMHTHTRTSTHLYWSFDDAQNCFATATKLPLWNKFLFVYLKFWDMNGDTISLADIWHCCFWCFLLELKKFPCVCPSAFLMI